MSKAPVPSDAVAPMTPLRSPNATVNRARQSPRPSASSRSRSNPSPRCSRLFTVASGTPVAPAISLGVSPSKKRSCRAPRHGSGRARKAACRRSMLSCCSARRSGGQSGSGGSACGSKRAVVGGAAVLSGEVARDRGQPGAHRPRPGRRSLQRLQRHVLQQVVGVLVADQRPRQGAQGLAVVQQFGFDIAVHGRHLPRGGGGDEGISWKTLPRREPLPSHAGARRADGDPHALKLVVQHTAAVLSRRGAG